MDFRIVIDQSQTAAAQTATQGQPAQPGDPDRLASPDWQLQLHEQQADRFATAPREAMRDYVNKGEQKDWAAEYQKTMEEIYPTAERIKEQLEQEAQSRARRLDEMDERNSQFPAEQEVRQRLEEEALLRARHLEVMKERFEQDSAAAEAGRKWEEELLWRQRSLEVLKERHQIEGAAVEEARLQLENEKENRDWQRQVKAERGRQNPTEALAGLAEQAGMGSLSKMLRLGQRAGEEFSGKAAQATVPQAQAGGQGGGGGAGGIVQKAAGMLGGEGEAAGGAAGGAETLGGLGGAAGAAGGALSSLAAAAGPVGLALEIGMQGQALLASGIAQAGKGIDLVGSQMARFVRDDHMGAMIERMDAVGDAIGQVPLFGDTLKAVNSTIVAVPKAFLQVQREFEGLAQNLSQYSANITQAQAEAEVRKFESDSRESERLGPTLARLVESQSRTEQAMRDISSPLKKALSEMTTIPNELAAKLSSSIAAKLEEWGIIDYLNSNVDAIAAALRKFLDLEKLDPDNTLDELVRGAFERAANNRIGSVNPGDGRANPRMFNQLPNQRP